MAKITLRVPDNPYRTMIDTDVMGVEIRECFLGVCFLTEDGEKLAVCMRDGGFEVKYSGDYGEIGFDCPWVEFKGGHIQYRKGISL